MKKTLFISLWIISTLLIIIGGSYILLKDKYQIVKQENHTPQAMMFLIEFKQTEGLANMVNDMNERGIKGLLTLSPDFAEENSEELKKILSVGNVEVIPSYVQAPLWDIPYEEQLEIVKDTKERVEQALDIETRIISSRYMASDTNTVKVAQELGIEYITARGTTELATTIYKPEEYDVKIISVSNIDTPEFKYGSLCDYSYYERAGNPEDMLKDLNRATEEEKFLSVSHTYIGGYKERWNNMWKEFWNNNIEWVDLDTLGETDKELPMWQIPINKNAPYTPEKINPLIPYDQETNVSNPCAVDEL